MLKEKREKGATVGTPTSSPHEGAATPPHTPPTSCHSMMIIKEERGVKQEPDQDTSGSPKKEVSNSPNRPQTAEKKSDTKENTEEMASQEQKSTSQSRTDATNATSESEPPFASSIQPLVSNIMGKQSGGLEYMQQSSQIFVFSTSLANKGAESVLSGHFPSIIAYHCAQPGTKKILEKHPLKLGQFNRNTPWAMMGNFGQKAPPPGCRPKNPSAMLEAPESLEVEAGGDPSWPEGIKSELPDDLPNGNASLVQGVKVPDENLTPQQRQHREEQLAMIRKMHLMLFPEQSDGEPGEVPPDGEEKPCPEFLACPNQPVPMAAPGGGAYKPEWGRLPPRQRAHGPPPPYHQTPRSASVPIATHSPSPNSPQNLTSTLSLPSPRGGALASPSDTRHAPLRHLSAGQSPVASPAGARPMAQSSPATPSSAHLSPCPLPDDKLPGSPAKESPEKGAGFFDISPDGGGPDNMGAPFALPDDNIPLNPDTSTAPETTKVMPFDPISSLAQMSQQLTSTAPPFSAPGPQNACSYGEMQHLREPEEAMMECQMHGMMVPQPDMGMHNPAYSKILPPSAGKPLSPKMVPGGVVHGPGGGGFSGGQMPRMGAPAGRLCPPASMADSYNGASVQVRASAPNTIQYLPARPQMCPQMPRPPPSLEFLQRFANPMPHNGEMGAMVDAGRGVRVRHDTQGHMMNGMFGHEGLFQGPPMRHPGGPFGPGGHDKMMEPPTSQPYVGPSTADPNYAQQFHNFQQQLYATTTRSGGAQGPPAAPYFINK